MGSEGHQDIDLAILTALLKGNICKSVDTHMHLWGSARISFHFKLNFAEKKAN